MRAGPSFTHSPRESIKKGLRVDPVLPQLLVPDRRLTDNSITETRDLNLSVRCADGRPSYYVALVSSLRPGKHGPDVI